MLIAVFSIPAMAQEGGSDRKVRFGIVVNPGLSWLKSSTIELEGKGAGIAFGYGLQLEFRLSDYVSISTGILQSNYNASVLFKDSVNLTYVGRSGGEDLAPVTSLIEKRTYVFNSVELPFKLKLKTPEIGYFTYFVELGLVGNVNYNVYAKKNRINVGGITSELTNDLEKIIVNDETNWFRAGSIIDLGFEYNFVGNTSLLVSVNWSNSFTNALSKNSKSLTYFETGKPFEQSAKLDYVGLTVGVLF